MQLMDNLCVVLRENPEAMGTSLDMLRRAAMTLLNLARHPDNRPLFVQVLIF